MILGCQSLEHRMLNAEFRSFYFEIQDLSFDIRHFSIHCASAFKIAFIRCRVNNHTSLHPKIVIAGHLLLPAKKDNT